MSSEHPELTERVAVDDVTGADGRRFTVSTICLGRFSTLEDATEYETMLFRLDQDGQRHEVEGYTRRWATEADALTGHRATVELLRERGGAL